ncbi:MAG: chalcone isomerase family protein [Oceanospirillaceae bacterium]
MLAKICLCLILYCPIAIAQSLPTHWKMVGKATLSVLWFDIYTAEFLTRNGKYSGTKEPLILKLNYLRAISQRQLLQETNKQLQRFTSKKQAALWIRSLASIWPDIKKGDQLAFWIDSQGTGHFFLKNSWIGSIKDQAFSAGFISIWLSRESSYPNLAKKLRGEP